MQPAPPACQMARANLPDAASIAGGQLQELGYFDVYPADDQPEFQGTWSNYPFYGEDIVAVSGIDSGLFVLRPRLG